MLDKTIFKIAFGGLFHDIGKFIDRDLLSIDNAYIEKYEEFLPYHHNKRSHHHALYSAAFLDLNRHLLPPDVMEADYGEGDSLFAIVAGHHAPATPLQWIVAKADRLSSGLDRPAEDESYLYEVDPKEHKKTRLLSIFEEIFLQENKKPSDLRFIYALSSISPESIFPKLREKALPKSVEEAQKDYKSLFDSFLSGLKELGHRKDALHLWLDHVRSLMMIHTAYIPSARAGKILPDVSLYDHSLTTSALATALYLYHKENKTLSETAIRDDSLKKFLLISGDFFGIQDFIFKGFGDIRRFRSKLLRGRSFSVSLYTELAAHYVCERIGLPTTSVLFNAAGRFLILAPNTPSAHRAYTEVSQEVTDWFFKRTFGETSITFSHVEASAEDFYMENFSSLWEASKKALGRKKFQRIDLNKYAGTIEGYLDSFNNTLARDLCPFCGKRPSVQECEGTKYVGHIKSACALCRDHLFIGSNIPNSRYLLIFRSTQDETKKENKLFDPIFGLFNISFTAKGTENLDINNDLLLEWEFPELSKDELRPKYSIKFINGHVPRYKDDDRYDDRLITAKTLEEETSEITIREYEPMSFYHIAHIALNFTDTMGKYEGVPALGILKADVDNLGKIFSNGLPKNLFTISRLSTLSRKLDMFFSYYVPYLLHKEERYRYTYTVFAGGDDLFLIGPWNKMVQLSLDINKRFQEYTCMNPHIHLSAGIALCKPDLPMDQLSILAEEACKTSKEASPEKNRITVFGETVKWEQLSKLLEIGDQLEDWLNIGYLTRVNLYKINNLISMAKKEEMLLKAKAITIQDLSCTKWRAYLAYFVSRKKDSQENNSNGKALKERVYNNLAAWLETYKGALRIALWAILYNRRRWRP